MAGLLLPFCELTNENGPLVSRPGVWRTTSYAAGEIVSAKSVDRLPPGTAARTTALPGAPLGSTVVALNPAALVVPPIVTNATGPRSMVQVTACPSTQLPNWSVTMATRAANGPWFTGDV